MNKILNTTLGSLIEFQRGFDLPKTEFKFGNVPVISSNGILGYHNQFKVKGPGITIGRSGTVGLPHFINENFFPHNTALFVKDFKGNYPKYIFYLLKTLSLNDRGSGSGVPTMNRNHLHPLKVSAHLDYNDQKSIAKVLSDLDAKIELNNRINRELEAMAKTLYDYWFVQFDFPNEQGKPYKSSGGKMMYNAELKREIPEGWEVKKLAEIANITMGQSPEGSSYNDDGIGEIFFQGSTDFGWRYPTIRQFTTEPSRRAKAGDILLSVRAPVGTLNIADNNCCIGRGLAALNSKSGYDSYLYYVMEYFKQIFDYRNNAGTTFGSITKDDLFSLKLIYPKDDILKKYNQIVYKYNQTILNNHKQNQQLSELRDWLLPMLMNGQVTVKEAEEKLSMAAEPSVEYKKG
ncbi:MAG: restriction endonuclease subunit S [Prolixibacteraceae bacterium]|nr:restriction endonuclease subunit S [Prolixibacteraceae bacterium]